jgi:hypothetical protein
MWQIFVFLCSCEIYQYLIYLIISFHMLVEVVSCFLMDDDIYQTLQTKTLQVIGKHLLISNFNVNNWDSFNISKSTPPVYFFWSYIFVLNQWIFWFVNCKSVIWCRR